MEINKDLNFTVIYAPLQRYLLFILNLSVQNGEQNSK